MSIAISEVLARPLKAQFEGLPYGMGEIIVMKDQRAVALSELSQGSACPA